MASHTLLKKEILLLTYTYLDSIWLKNYPHGEKMSKTPNTLKK